MKTYKTWEIIKKLEENPSLNIESRQPGEEKFTAHTFHDTFLKSEFKIVEKPVTFMEAINSGKRIKPINFPVYKCYEDLLCFLSACSGKEIIRVFNDKWNIEE